MANKAVRKVVTPFCAACGEQNLISFADLGKVAVRCGVHWARAKAAASSPVGQMRLAYCPECAYVRNIAFNPAIMVYDKSMDTNLHHSPAFQAYSAQLAAHLADRYQLAGKRALDIGCGQGEFLRELCRTAGCTGVGYDAMYAGAEGTQADGVTLLARHAPAAGELAEFDLFTSRHWIEHLADPYQLLAGLRERAGDREVYGYIEVPDAAYDLSTAGWEVIYPHVSYFDLHSLCRLAQRAGWRVEDTGTHFHGMFGFIELSANRSQPRHGTAALPGLPARDAQLASIAGFAQRHHEHRLWWRNRIAQLADDGARPVLWGAGSRGVQLLNWADPHRLLAAVVDVNPRKWGRYLPVTAHRVSPPQTLATIDPRAVIITNPAYQAEIDATLRSLGVTATLLVA